VLDRQLDLPTPDGVMGTFVTHPEEGGPHPVVLLLMDAPGMREELRDMARRLGTAGYYVMAPNLYYRDVAEFSIFSGDPAHTRERMWELMQRLDDDMVVGDAEVLLAAAEDDPAADTRRVGVMGFCMSGPFAVAVACARPTQVRAAASLHGVRLWGPGSPSERITPDTGELYFACAEFDDFVPAGTVDGLERHLAAVGADARVERYPGTHHGFTFPGRDGAYDKPSAERMWERLHALFSRTLH